MNGQPLTKQVVEGLSPEENNLAFQYLALNFQQAGRIPYRYRLNEGDWNFTQERFARFVQLPPSSYRLEVQSQNEDGLWSRSLVHDFRILTPWWQRWWFYALLVTALATSFFIFYKYRTGILKNEIAFKEQVTDLEKKALQAQMNPHFIFNCLTSIQKLILEKDAENAMRYLNRFSKLVRGTLNASVAGEITLQEEIELLHNYLELEKLRFKDAFEYEVSVHPSLDVFDIAFSPMLLQPYVENAIVHGMRDKDGDGKVEVSFHPLGEQVVAIIADNGPGIALSSKLNPDHKSVGMTLTKRRLELMHNDRSNEGLVQVFEIEDGKGGVLGTRVRVQLR